MNNSKIPFSGINLPIEIKQSIRIPIAFSVLTILLMIFKFLILSQVIFLDIIWRYAFSSAVVVLCYLFLKRLTTSYTLDALEIVEHTGIIFQRVRRIPLNRITNYETQSRVIERVLGLSRLAIDTPGGDGFEMIIKEIPREQLRYVITALSVLFGEQKIIDAGGDPSLSKRRENALQEKVSSIVSC